MFKLQLILMGRKSQAKMDEFVFILLAAVVFIVFLAIVWTPGSEPAPVIDRKIVELSIINGSSTTFLLTINGTEEGKLSNVTLTPLGDVRDWVSFSKNNFDIENSATVRVTVTVPKAVVFKTYTGTIKVSSRGGETTLSLNANVANVTDVKLNSRAIFLGSIAIRHAAGSETLISKNDLEIAKGYFGQSPETIFFSIPSEKFSIITGGQIRLNIQETNKQGNLIVLFNNMEILNRKVSGDIVIPIDKSLINSTNTIVIKTINPPIFKFWSQSFYKIKEMSFVTGYQDTGESEKSFDLSNSEIASFKYFKLTGKMVEYTTPLQELLVKINNQLAYSRSPPLTFLNEKLEQDILGNPISLKNNNTVSLSLEKDGMYKIDDVFIIVYYY